MIQESGFNARKSNFDANIGIGDSNWNITSVESEFPIDIDKKLDAITTSDKYIVSNIMEMSDSIGTDLDDD